MAAEHETLGSQLSEAERVITEQGEILDEIAAAYAGVPDLRPYSLGSLEKPLMRLLAACAKAGTV